MSGLDLIAALCARWSTTKPLFAVQRAIADAFPDLTNLSPPIDVYQLAGRRGITRVIDRDMSEDGLIVSQTDGTYTVYLNKLQPLTRQRFTLAHEIAHTLFFDLDGSPEGTELSIGEQCLLTHTRNGKLEYCCNLAAAELLMPVAQFNRALQELGFFPRALGGLAREFQVSLQAAARRAVSFAPARVAFIMWEQDGNSGAFHSVWHVGLAAGNRMRLCVSATDPAHGVFANQGSFSRYVLISLGGPLEEYFLDGCAIPSERARRLLTVVSFGDPRYYKLKSRSGADDVSTHPVRRSEPTLL